MKPGTTLRRIARLPLLHFLLLGALLLGLDVVRGTKEGAPARDPLVVDDADVELLVAEHRRIHGETPDAADRRALVEAWIDEELAVREARRLGLLEGDLLIRRRLAEKLELLGTPAGGDPFHTALALGLDRHDPIVRRRLVQRLHRVWAQQAEPVAANDEALRRQLEARPEDYRRPPAARVSHVYLAPSRSLEDAESLLARLRREEIPGSDAAHHGDPFPGTRHLPLRNLPKLRSTLGPEAARHVADAPLGRWTGPLRSAWGWHLLWVHERRPGRLPAVEEIQRELLHDLRRARREATIDRAAEALRRSWPVEIATEDPA